MKVAIASLGRFHVLDLARELHTLGEDVAFFSYVPRRRAQRFGLSSACHRPLLARVAPYLLWQHKLPKVAPGLQERLMAEALDRAVIRRLGPCDAFVCMSGTYLAAARHAKDAFGARIYLERGSQHILAQRRLLQEAGAARVPSDFIVARECAGYDLADRIVVPSSAVVESFLSEAPHLAQKLFVNPYGVDLDLFPQRPSRAPRAQALFVGSWSRRKGVDILTQAIRHCPGVRLTHVGAMGDADFPVGDPQFTHVGTIPQWELSRYYQGADVFVLASREEGLALVQPQALASGLPLVCTTRTGGADLALSPGLARRIRVVPPEDPLALASAITASLREDRAVGLDAGDRELLSWAAYGARYQAELHAGVDEATGRPEVAA